MGLKYIEQLKSVVLVLLILLSFTLTFAIWTYSPVIQTIEETTVDISIAEKKKMEDVIKPYRMIISQEGELTGSFNSKPNMKFILNQYEKLGNSNCRIRSNKANTDQINEFIKKPNRASLFFAADVPVEVLGYDLKICRSRFSRCLF